MLVEFRTDDEPPLSLFDELAAASPTNPFCTSAYAEAMRKCSERPWIISLRDDKNVLIVGAAAFMRSGRLTRSLEIPSLPAIGDDRVFWDGLLGLCAELSVTVLHINTFASTATRIPLLPRELQRVSRVEYVIPLHNEDLSRRLRKTHRWRVNRGRRAGLTMKLSKAEADCRTHCSLISASMKRRAERGEDVSTRESAVSPYMALLSAGAGELFQASLNDVVLSSALVLTSRTGGYLQTSGTNAEGMEWGASQFLVFEIARLLQERGMTTFNLGGIAGSNPGLREFKMGFGAEPVVLEAVSCRPTRGLRGILVEAVGEVRRHWSVDGSHN
jgi:GNAT acetyltransferase-like protein